MESIVPYTNEEDEIITVEAVDIEDDDLHEYYQDGIPWDNDKAIGWLVGISGWNGSLT